MKKNDFCVASFSILTFFEVANGSKWLILVVSAIPPSNSSYKYEKRISDNRWLFFSRKMHYFIVLLNLTYFYTFHF